MADKKDPFAAYQKPLKSSGNDPFSAYQKPAMDFTPTPGMGTYRMLPSSQQGYTDGSKEIQVSYDKVNDALKSGLRLHPDEEKSFKDDSTHEGQGPSLWEKTKKFYDEQTTPIPDYEQRPIDPKHPITSTLGRLGDASANVGLMVPNTARAAVRGVVGLFSILPQSKEIIEKVRNGDPSAFNDLAEFYPPRIAYNMLDQYKNDANTVGPTQALSNLTGNMTALYVGGKAGGKLGEKVKETASHPAEALNNVKTKAANIKDVPGNLVRKTAEIVTNTQPRNVKDLGTKAWSDALEHKNATAEELGKRSDTHDAEVKAVKEHNARVAEKHKVASEKIEREREAAEHELELRRSEELNLHKSSEVLDQKIEGAKKTATARVNKAFDGVRNATGGRKTPLAPVKAVVEVAKGQADPVSSPIFKSIINEGDEVSSKDGVLVVNGMYRPVFSGGKQVLFDDPNFADAYEAQYKEPAPLVGGETDFNRLQRWYTYLGDKIYNGGRLEAGTYNALNMTRDAIGDAMRSITDASGDVPDPNDPNKTVSVTSLWDNARKLNTEKMEAFSDSPNEPPTVASKAQGKSTPKFVEEKLQAERLKKIAQAGNDPSIVDHAENIEKIKKRLKMTKDEEQLRARLPRPIPPPSLDHPEETYRLKREPEPFTGKPTERDEPTGERKHDESGKTVWAEDKLKDRIKPVSISEDDASKIAKSADEFRKMGIRRALFAGLTGLAFSATTFLNGVGMEHSALGGLGAAGAVLMGSDWIANLLDRPDFVKWMSKVTPAKIEEFNKLPPEQKALFTEDMRKIADAARNKGIKVSPDLDQWLMKERSIGEGRIAGASAAGASQKKRNDLVDEWNKAHPDKQVTPPQPSSSPSSTEAPQTMGGQSRNQTHTHVWNPETQTIEAV